MNLPKDPFSLEEAHREMERVQPFVVKDTFTAFHAFGWNNLTEEDARDYTQEKYMAVFGHLLANSEIPLRYYWKSAALNEARARFNASKKSSPFDQMPDRPVTHEQPTSELLIQIMGLLSKNDQLFLLEEKHPGMSKDQIRYRRDKIRKQVTAGLKTLDS